MVDRHQEIIMEIQEDLNLQASVILTDRQLNILNRTQQLRFPPSALDNNAVTRITNYLRDTPADCRVWDAAKSLSDGSIVIAIRLMTQYVTIMLI
ncbi:hypothetical protein ACFQ5M_13605 [Agrilactobacillus yilanensis]|uniref:Uncharacterized protein n=1 Tax=Agrilactobacillus yilanensis TaxID=2485997 RepID=A0ABW4J9Q0_9LACO|nr:hypothetical protein [Agrilactobacillus yilanensis]